MEKKFHYMAMLVFFFTCTLQITSAQIQRTNLPSLYITTDGNAAIADRETWIPGSLNIIAAGETGLYNGRLEIRGRGNSSWLYMTKKPYRIKLDVKTNLLGMPAKEKNWVLLANAIDKTLIRNGIGFEISAFTGMAYTPAYRLVDVFLNNTYIGNYTLTDQVEVADKRINIEKQSLTDVATPAIEGGYLIEADGFAHHEPAGTWFTTTKGMKFTRKYPKDDEINTQQKAYIDNYVQQLENKIFATNFRDPVAGYKNDMDIISLANWYLISEIVGNSDCFWSVYMYKKRSSNKLFTGPMWDFDIAFNNDNRINNALYRRMFDVGNGPATKAWVKRFLDDDSLNAAIKKRWTELKNAGFKTFILNKVDSLRTRINQSQQQNYGVWDISLQEHIGIVRGNYNEEADFLKDHLSKRIDWIDKEFGDIDTTAFYKIESSRFANRVISPGNDEGFAVQKIYSGTANKNHQWDIKNLGNGFYKIINRGTSKVLQAPTSGTQLVLRNNDVNNLSQQWRITQITSNTFGIVNRSNGQGINHPNNNAADGTITQSTVDFFATDFGTNRKWVLTIAEEKIYDPLPIIISDFKANAKQKEIILTWQIHSMENANRIDIERSTDGITHTVIGSIPLYDNRIGLYSFTDNQPYLSVNQYRLKLIDNDASYKYSNTVSVRWHENISVIMLSPIPVKGSAVLSFTATQKGSASIGIYNSAGSKLRSSIITVSTGYNQQTIDMADLQKGIYIMEVKYNNTTTIIKFTKDQ